MPEKKEATVTIDDKEYKISEMSDEAKGQLLSYNFSENEMKRLQAQLALATTARNAYRKALIEILTAKA